MYLVSSEGQFKRLMRLGGDFDQPNLSSGFSQALVFESRLAHFPSRQTVISTRTKAKLCAGEKGLNRSLEVRREGKYLAKQECCFFRRNRGR